MISYDQILKKPLLTEKTTADSDNFNRYSFEVERKANKYQIKNAVEKLFDVKVEKVWTSITPGKMKRFGRYIKKTAPVKKAHVRVANGQKIEFFKGV